MQRNLRRASVAAGVVALVLALTPAVSNAGAQMPLATVSGTAACSTAGPVGRYTLNWTLHNGEASPITVTSATESGAFAGTVTFTPSPIPAAGSGTGSDGPVEGTTVGTVTLTVVYAVVDGPSFTVTGTIQLAGNCVISSTTSSSSTSTTKAPTTTATVAAITVTPRFTG